MFDYIEMVFVVDYMVMVFVVEWGMCMVLHYGIDYYSMLSSIDYYQMPS